MQRFGEKLHTLRKQHGLTMRELAPLLDISSFSFISKLENGSQMPSPELIVKIARFFEVSTDRLMLDELEIDE